MTFFSSPHQEPGRLLAYGIIDTAPVVRDGSSFSSSNMARLFLLLPRRLQVPSLLPRSTFPGPRWLILQDCPVGHVLSETPLVQTSQATPMRDLKDAYISFMANITAAAH